MRKLVLWGFVLVSVSILCFLNVTPIEQRTLSQDGTITPTASATKPMPVEVTNYPATQNVAGTVNVGNLPAVQQVGGNVAVSNLPVDGNGNMKIAANIVVQAASIRFLGFSQATPMATPLDLSNLCSSEIQGSRMCTLEEFVLSIPPPPTSFPVARVLYPQPNAFTVYCTTPTVTLAGCGDNSNLVVVACCGY